jgi:phosphate:Na+ symporter
LMSGDVTGARKLIAEKAELRSAELSAAERHLERLREGRPETLETTSLHMDILRDLKRINSHICSVAYPALEGRQESLIASEQVTLPPAKPKPRGR